MHAGKVLIKPSLGAIPTFQMGVRFMRVSHTHTIRGSLPHLCELGFLHINELKINAALELKVDFI